MKNKKLIAILCVVLNITLIIQLGSGYIFATSQDPDVETEEIEELQPEAAAECCYHFNTIIVPKHVPGTCTSSCTIRNVTMCSSCGEIVRYNSGIVDICYMDSHRPHVNIEDIVELWTCKEGHSYYVFTYYCTGCLTVIFTTNRQCTQCH